MSLNPPIVNPALGLRASYLSVAREVAARFLKAGDKVLIRNTGAYTSSYSSIGFNGFPPLAVVVI